MANLPSDVRQLLALARHAQGPDDADRERVGRALAAQFGADPAEWIAPAQSNLPPMAAAAAPGPAGVLSLKLSKLLSIAGVASLLGAVSWLAWPAQHATPSARPAPPRSGAAPAHATDAPLPSRAAPDSQPMSGAAQLALAPDAVERAQAEDDTRERDSHRRAVDRERGAAHRSQNAPRPRRRDGTPERFAARAAPPSAALGSGASAASPEARDRTAAVAGPASHETAVRAQRATSESDERSDARVRTETGALRSGTERATALSPSSRAESNPHANAEAAPSSESPGASGRLAEELRLIRAASHALDARDGARALEWVGEHQAEFARGALSQEREALRVAALCQLGRHADAARLRQLFERQHPRSPLRVRIAAHCKE